MAKFLNSSTTNFLVEELINGASEKLIIIVPILEFNDRIKELLEDKSCLTINIRIVYGKSKLKPGEINWLKEHTYIRTTLCKDIKIECYLSEELCIIAGMSHPGFSQGDYTDVGVLISRAEDVDLYNQTCKMAQEFIRVNDLICVT